LNCFISGIPEVSISSDGATFQPALRIEKDIPLNEKKPVFKEFKGFWSLYPI
jgi:hypothetical protein